MAEEAANNQVPPEQPPSSFTGFSVLQQLLEVISQTAITGTFLELNEPIVSLVRFLDTVSDSAIYDSAFNDTAYTKAVLVLSHIQGYICNPSLDKRAIDALSFPLPKSIAKFAGLSKQCSEIVECVFDEFAEKCDSGDMIAIFSEALSCYGTDEDALGYAPPLLHGLSKAFLSMGRPQFEMVQEAIPAVLSAVKVASSDTEFRNDTRDVFEKAIGLATSIEATCEKWDECRVKEQLRALLGLFLLEIMALVSISMGNEEGSIDLVLQLLRFFPYCGFSYLGLLTGRDVKRIYALIVKDDSDDYMDEFPYVKQGAVLSVIWSYISVEASRAAEQDMSMLKDEIQSMQIERWEAVGMLSYMLSEELSWKWKEHAINFFLTILDSVKKPQIDKHKTCCVQIPTLSPTLKAIMMVMNQGPNATLRKNAFTALKLVLADIPGSFRFDLLQVLIRNSSSSSYMMSILLDCAKEFLRSEYPKKEPDRAVIVEETFPSLWSANVLQLVEIVLSPPGAKPSLPRQCVAVTSALSLYRFLIVTESEGKTNYTGVLSENNLVKAYEEWLLPLQTLVTDRLTKCRGRSDKLSEADTIALNPLLFVLNGNIQHVKGKLERLGAIPTRHK